MANENWVPSFSRDLLSYFDDETTWREHQAELEQMVDWVRKQDAQLLVLIWPFLDEPAIAEGPARLVEQFFAEREVPVVNMLDVIAGVSPSQRMVSAIDRHPSVYVHQLAAQALYDLLSEKN